MTIEQRMNANLLDHGMHPREEADGRAHKTVKEKKEGRSPLVSVRNAPPAKFRPKQNKRESIRATSGFAPRRRSDARPSLS